MLVPKRVKYRKQFRGTMRGNTSRRTKLEFGQLGLKALASSWITTHQLEAARRAIAHFTKRGGRIWIRVFPDRSITKKGAETPMGGGKGEVFDYVAPVKAGTIILEVGALPQDIARQALRLAAFKLPIKTRVIIRE